ncbi:hypothetical protein [Streptomyces sp. TRM49041]|uniref:hypothetical protein n=1 Tax=Streptomyces sp. TRM49041 TaxID=2603216 RepID=UPI0016568A7A|nr:hypothetical protein [Streptomyces sp. TRM49041]
MSTAPGRSECSTAYIMDDHAMPWQYVGRPRTYQRYDVPSTEMVRERFFGCAMLPLLVCWTLSGERGVRPWV